MKHFAKVMLQSSDLLTLAFSLLIGIVTSGLLNTHVYASRNRGRSSGQSGSYQHHLPPTPILEPSTPLVSLSQLTSSHRSLYHSRPRAPFNSRYIHQPCLLRPMTMSTHLMSNPLVRRSGTSRLKALYQKLSTTFGCAYPFFSNEHVPKCFSRC